MKYLSIVALFVLIAGCNRQPSGEHASSSPSSASPSAQQSDNDAALGTLPAIQAPTNPEEVLVELGAHKLTRQQADADIDMRVAASGQNIPPAQAQMMRSQLMGKIIEQFVVRSLLLDEAEKEKIETTAEDEKQAYDRIEEYLKSQGRTLEDALEQSPMGKERMMEEVKVGVTIDKLLASRLPKPAEPTEDEIKAFVEESGERLNVPERVTASHILLSVEADADAATRDSKRQEAERLRAELTNGASFETLAREHSDCPSSARGGDLGSFGRGQMVKPFEEAAFSQKPEEIGPVVETQFGYHIIKVTAHDQPGQIPQKEIVEFIQQRKRQEDVKQLVDSLLAQSGVKYADSIASQVPDSVQVPASTPPAPASSTN